MNYIIENHTHEYETQTIIQVFRPNERYTRLLSPPTEGFCVLCRKEENGFRAIIFENGIIMAENFEKITALPYYQNVLPSFKHDEEEHRALKTAIFRAFLSYGEHASPWGILTGIRPAKIARKLLESFPENYSLNILKDIYFLAEQKAMLAVEVAKKEQKILNNEKGTAALYIGVPFCPSKCLYCSFTSYPVDKYYSGKNSKMEQYFSSFTKEIVELGKLYKNEKVDIIYVGGGTPTSLNEYYFEKLLSLIAENFRTDISEFTVEAGRPDSTTLEKLRILRRYNVGRISINPQTLNDKILETIGRKHTVADFFACYENAQAEGFRNINIDLIAGLPNETVSGIEETFRQIALLSPTAVTVHTLAVKRASALNHNLAEYSLSDYSQIEKQLAAAENFAQSANLKPYYMYRQKNMLGNFENVGYCAEGFECAYNVHTMEESLPIIGIGAGSVTKILSDNLSQNDKIDRIFNPKGIEDYINNIDEIIERKKKAYYRKK
ncbi:MAG: coproporphyrinogen dehydrogenase HemZ [Clostridiales bacterium]|jgi:oxygen-independent coproporphyrinogen-3 oxidase|nr:coproporphyrinogen dehydrogenase HemZ [Clostridiales bacterium]